jgi:hypothetical protein
MARDKGPWYDDPNPDRVARQGGVRIGVVFLAFLVFFGIVGAIVWGVSVAVSDVKGRGDVVRKTNDADNRIFAQENFHQRYQDIKATDRKLDQAAIDAARPGPGQDAAIVRYNGLVSYCQSVVGEYNTDARRVTKGKFRDEDLPAEIDMTDPATDCKEAAR